MFRIALYSSLLCILFSCSPTEQSKIELIHLHEWNMALEDAIVNDFFSPPVAGRIYAYANLAAYESLVINDSTRHSIIELSDSLTSNDIVLSEIAAGYAFYTVSSKLVYSIESLKNLSLKLDSIIANTNLDKKNIEASKQLGIQIAEKIIDLANKDGYNAMRSYKKYTPLEEKGKWQPTPPDYMEGLEPHWSKLKPLTLDSTSQFQPQAPTAFNLDTSSQFFKETLEVYEALNSNTSETEAIAKFWDCNPLVIKHQGHVTFAEKKLTPGGHWMSIARIAMKQSDLSLIEVSEIYTQLSIGIHEAFISCWDEKYRSNYIRPVTVIQEFIDPNWNPILYTPNFPEYPSGHSVVSASAATILTHFFGSDFKFIDSTEVPYGMSPRSYNSFFEAADEAAISRLYGGIHFMPAIENGKTQGRLVGQHVLKSLNVK